MVTRFFFMPKKPGYYLDLTNYIVTFHNKQINVLHTGVITSLASPIIMTLRYLRKRTLANFAWPFRPCIIVEHWLGIKPKYRHEFNFSNNTIFETYGLFQMDWEMRLWVFRQFYLPPLVRLKFLPNSQHSLYTETSLPTEISPFRI